MSGQTISPAKAPKTMSSKLLTMKFMQRAAASSPNSTPSTPDQPSPKRQRIGDSSPANLNIDSLADQRAVQAALAAEEAKRQTALERQAADAGDTRWVLTFKPDVKTSHIQGKTSIRVVETGFAAIDHALPAQITSTSGEDVNSDRPLIVGRRSFGKFNRVIEELQDPSKVDLSDSDTDEDEDKAGDESEDSGDDDPNGTNALIKAAQEANATKLRAERKERRKAEKAEGLRLGEKRRKKKDINLNHLKTISGKNAIKGASVANKGPKQDPKQFRTCRRCGQNGHLQSDCPEGDSGGDFAKAGDTLGLKRPLQSKACYRCGQTGHFKSDCPEGSQRRWFSQS